MLILRPKVLVTVDVLYYIPRSTILQELIFQTEDMVPDCPRVYKFRDFWFRNIDAHLSEIVVYANSKEPIRIIP
jgi:uncharacterized protein Usg